MRTLRARTTALVVLVTGLTLAAGAMLLVLSLQSRLVASNDRVDLAHLRQLVLAVEAGEVPDPITDIDEDGVGQVVASDGTVLARSANIAAAGPISDRRPGTEPAVSSTVAPDDDEAEHYRLWAGAATGPDGRPSTVYVGTSEEAVTEASRTVGTALLAGVPLATALLGVATWLILGRALRRVDAIRVEVDTITDDQLHRRVPAPAVDDEIGRLASTMNRMLSRLEDSTARQRTFIADASHDLQSPLTAQRARLEVALAEADRTDLRPLVGDLLAGNAEMERLVRDLLFLAADDSGARPPPSVPLDLDDLVLEEATRLRPTTEVRIDTSGVSAAPVRGDRAQLGRLVRNLLENATRHAHSTVTLDSRVEDDQVVLEVRDDGPGVDPGDAERVFDRFFRGDGSRSRADGTAGTGLGLAIARTVARRHGGDLSPRARRPRSGFPGPAAHALTAGRSRVPALSRPAPRRASPRSGPGRRQFVHVRPHLGHVNDDAVAHGEEGGHLEVLQAPLGLGRHMGAPGGSGSRTDAVLEKEPLESGVLRVQPHPGVAVEGLAGVHEAAAEVPVQQRGQLIPAVPVENVGQPPHHLGSVHLIIVTLLPARPHRVGSDRFGAPRVRSPGLPPSHGVVGSRRGTSGEAIEEKLMLERRLALCAAVVCLPLLATAPASAEPPRPGCGYGDDNHSHQAAPGRDPMNLRPGRGSGDDNHPHTAPPGQAPDNAGDQSGPMRGCTAAP